MRVSLDNAVEDPTRRPFDSDGCFDVDATIASSFQGKGSSNDAQDGHSSPNTCDDSNMLEYNKGTSLNSNCEVQEIESDTNSGTTTSMIAFDTLAKEDIGRGISDSTTTIKKLFTTEEIFETLSTSPIEIQVDQDACEKTETKSHAAEIPRKVGFIGGVCLLINNLAGPTLTLLPGLCQEAGWLNMVVLPVVAAAIAAMCGFMLIEALRSIPGNANFQRDIELGELTRFYCGGWVFRFFMFSFIILLVLNVMSYVIQTAVVLDFSFVGFGSCAYGLEYFPSFKLVCATDLESSTPFGDTFVFPLSFIILGSICAPLCWFTLGNSVFSQVVAIMGLTALASYWCYFLTKTPDFPQPVAVATPNTSSLAGTLVFNCALIPSLPSWIRERKEEVKIGRSVGVALGYVALVYSAIGVLGAAAFKDKLAETSETLFSKLNASGDPLARASLIAYPILQNVTSIPITCIFIKYNLMQSFGISHCRASLLSFFCPLLMAVPFYTGSNFEYLSSIGGGIFSFAINFVLPFVLFSRVPRVRSLIGKLRRATRL